MNQPQRLEDLLDENRWLREQLEAKSKVAARALAAQQRRVLEAEQAAAELVAVNDKLAAALRVLEDKDRRIGEDLEQARVFQQRILPRLPLSGADRRLSLAVAYRPAEVVGGDLYDVCRLASGATRVFLVDAIGHGVQAALRTMILKTEYDRVREAPSPGRALVELNRRIVAAHPRLVLQCTAACFDVAVDGDRARVAYATAAHPPLVAVDAAGARQVYQPAPFLGVLPGIELDVVELELRRGDRLFLFTDGLIEATRGEDQFGIERALEALGRRDADLERTVLGLVAAVEAFGGGELGDDLTLIGVEIGGERSNP